MFSSPREVVQTRCRPRASRGRLRASRADRERVMDTLKAAYVYGLVTKDEFDERVSQTFAARTYAELAMITADIPAGLPAAPPSLRPSPTRANHPVAANVTAADRALMAIGYVADLAMLASVFAGSGLTAAWFLGGVSILVFLLLLRIQMRSRRTKRPGGRLPPQRAIGSGPSAAHGAISATSAERCPHAAKPRRSEADAARRYSLRPQLSS
jgi:Domain of unknown function (DUF1707)